MGETGRGVIAGSAHIAMLGSDGVLRRAISLLGSMSMPQAIILMLCVFAMWWLWVFSRRARHLDMPLIPGPWKRGGLPLLGNLLDLIRPDFHHVLLDWANQYGGIYRLNALWTTGLIVTEPTAVAAICGRGEGALDKASLIYMPINQMCSPRGHPNLLTSSADPAWRAVRKAVAAAFSVQNIRKKFTVIRGCSQQLLDQLVCLSQQRTTTGQPPLTVDVDQCALRVTLDVIGMAGFGHDFGCIKPPLLVTEPAPTKHLLRVLPRCFTEVMTRIAIPFRALVPGWFKFGIKGEQSFDAFQREMRTLLRKCLLRDKAPPDDDMSIGAQLWRAYYEQTPAPTPPPARGGGKDLAPAEARGADDETEETAGGLLPPPPTPTQRFWLRTRGLLSVIGGKPPVSPPIRQQQALLSAERILSEIGILFIEGFETTGHTISWTLFNISTTPGVQERIASELDSLGLLVKGNKPVPPSHLEVDMLPRLTYLTACIKEAMRMLPVVSVMARMVGSSPTRVGKYLIPAGTPIGIPLFAIQNSYANWDRPHAFLPERWLKVPVESYVMGAMPSFGSAVNGRLSNGASSSSGSHGASSPPGSTSKVDSPASTSKVATGSSSKVASAASTSKVESTASTSKVTAGSTSKTALAAEPLLPSQQAQGSGANGGPPPAPQVRFMPFSEGPRNCVGQTLAKMEVVSFLALILGHFRVELAPEMGGRAGIRARESTHLTLQTKGTAGIRMVLHPRWDTTAA